MGTRLLEGGISSDPECDTESYFVESILRARKASCS